MYSARGCKMALASLAFLAALSSGQAAPASKPPRLIAALDTTEGVKLRPWSSNVQAELEVVTDPALVTQGKAALCIKARSGEPIPGRSASRYVSITLAVPAFSMRDRMMMVDVASRTPEHTRAFYVRLRDPKGREVGSWSSWRLQASAKPKTIRLQQGTNLDGLAYEVKRVKALDAPVATIEIITGTRDKNVAFDLIVDNVRLSEAMLGSLENLAKPRKLVRETVLKPRVRLIAPKTANVRPLVARLRELGTEVQVEPAANQPADWQTTAIVVGNVNTNAAVFPLYSHGYCFADLAFPGLGGYVIRTIHDPFGAGKNVVLIGASDETGLDRGLDAFITKLTPDLVLPPMVETKLDRDAERALARYFRPLSSRQAAARIAGARKRLDSGGARGVCSEMARLGLGYRLSGRADRAELFKGLMYEYEKWVYDKSRRYGAHEGQWGMDVDFTTYRLIPAWDALEECPVFTDADRLRISRLLGAFVEHDTYRCGRSVNRGPGPRHNHQTFPCLGLYFAGRYFSQFVSSFQANHWIETAANCFGCQATYLKAREDAAGYQWLVPQHTQRYGLAAGDMTPWLSGNARRLCNLALMLTDNLGHHPAFGDHRGFGGWGSEMGLLRYAAFVHRDGRYQWGIDKKLSVRRRFELGQYACDLGPLEPVDLAGVQWSPVPHIMYAHYKRSAKMPHAETFDKISFRQDFDDGTEYFLLDGISGTSHDHYDGNGVLRLVARERIWLEDGDYIKSLPKFHNTLLIFRDGQSEKPSTFAKLEELADFPRAGFSQTLLPDYAGADWRRSVVWLKGRGFVVIDTVTAGTAGDYRLRCVWRGMGEVQNDARSVVLEQQGEALRILSAGDGAMTLEDDPTRGHNWRGYKLAPPVVRVLGISDGKPLAAGESMAIYSVLRPSAGDDAGDLAARETQPGVVRVECDGKPFLCAAAPARRPEPVELCDGIATDAMMARFAADGFEVVDATRVRIGSWSLEATTPVHLSLDAGTGRARVLAREPGRLMPSNGDAVSFPAGRWEAELTGPASIPGFEPAEDRTVAFVPGPWKTAEAQADHGSSEDWRLVARPTRLLLTNNTGRFGAVDLGATCQAAPAPRESNCFSAASPNHLAALSDGVLRSTEASVMWPMDAKVSLLYDLKQSVRVSEVVLHVWFGSNSSRGQSFMTERIRVRVSNDNFQTDDRLVLDHVDDAKHDDWGQPLAVTCRPDRAECRWVRVELTPRKGSSVYLAEAEIWGDGDTIAWETMDSRLAADFLSVAPGPGGLVALGGSNGGVYLADGQGRQVWRSETGDRVPTVWCGDLDGDGSPEVVAGSRDGKVYCYSRDGALRWTFACEPYHGRSGALVCVLAADVDRDGKKEVIAGADNWHFHLLGHDGAFRWRYETVHRSTCGDAADLDGDGKLEILGCTEYYYSTVISHEGKRRWGQRGGPCMNCVATGDLDGDGKLEAAFGSANGVVYVAGHNGKQLWTYDTGDEITGVAFVDLDGDGTMEIAAGSLNFNVYAFNADGAVRWRRDLAAPVTHLETLPSPDAPLVAGCSSGLVIALGPTGQEVARRRAGGRPLALAKTADGAVLVSAEGRGLARLTLGE